MRRTVLMLAVVATVAAGCGSAPSAEKPVAPLKSLPAIGTETTTPPSAAPSLDIPSVSVPTVEPITKVLVFVEENHSLNQMKAGMPYAYSLAEQYGYASRFTAARHPSLPNYLVMAGGQTYGVSDDKDPSSHRLRGPSVFGTAIAAGKTAGTFVDGMPKNCYTSKGGDAYVPKHNPWAYFADERAQCDKFDVPLGALTTAIDSGALPNVGMVIPNLDNDAHDGSLGTADNWFKGWMTKIMAGPDWTSGRLVVILTADEDNRKEGNQVLTIVMNPRLHHKVVNDNFTHYSITRLFAEVSGTEFLGGAKSAPSIQKAFGLD